MSIHYSDLGLGKPSFLRLEQQRLKNFIYSPTLFFYDTLQEMNLFFRRAHQWCSLENFLQHMMVVINFESTGDCSAEANSGMIIELLKDMVYSYLYNHPSHS